MRIQDTEIGHAVKPYQTLPVRHLLATCPCQHGVLVYHGLGTGKSLTGISFIASLNEDVVLLAPAAIVDVWFAEAAKFGVDLTAMRKNKQLRVLTIESLQPGLPGLPWRGQSAGKYLVCDEAHNLCAVLRDLPTRDATRLYDWFLGFSKVLLLTGTPIYTKDSDFRMLINMAAGRQVLPLDDAKFRLAFFKTDKFRSVFFGWFMSFLDGLFYQTKDLAYAAVTYQTVRTNSSFAFQRNLFNFLNHFLHSAASAAAVTVALPLVLAVAVKGVVQVIVGSQIGKVRTLDATRVAAASQRYLSFYTIPNVEGGDFPTVQHHDRAVEYNVHQIDLWLRFALGHLTGDELFRLGLVRTPTDAELFAGVASEDVYKSVGRAIGNLEFKEKVGRGRQKPVPPPKFEALLAQLKKADGTPRQTVVYSSFWEGGIVPLSAFLGKMKVEHEVLDPSHSAAKKETILEQFFNKTCSVLLLHPDYTEGISIKGAERMHILEPVSAQATLLQIAARVKRMHSHAHLPANQRHVDIVVWHCQVTQFTKKLLKWGIKQKDWMKWNRHMGPWVERQGFRTDLTPDSLTLLQAEALSSTVSALQKAFASMSMATLKISKKRPKCKVAFDSNVLLPDCVPASDCKSNKGDVAAT